MITDAQVSAAVAACQKQIDNDFGPIWGLGASLNFVPAGQMNQIPANNMQLIFFDNSDVADALGYHTLTASGMPLAKIFVETAEQDGVPWTLTLSHELLEMIVDPWANLVIFAQSSNTSGNIISFEVCDPCQAPQSGYSIDGIIVSDFILPEWFGFFQVYLIFCCHSLCFITITGWIHL